MNKLWRWNLHGHISLAPATLLYAIACFVIYGARSWGFRNGVLVCIGERLGKIFKGTGAQTIGGCEVYADSVQINRVDLHVHENGHIVQQMVCALITQAVAPLVFAYLGWSWKLGLALGGFFGPLLWGVTYGVCFFGLWIGQRAGWRKAYRDDPYEQQCYAAQAKWLASDAATRAQAWT